MKNKILVYFLLRLFFLVFCLVLINHFAFYFLPKNIQQDQFSFVGELNLTVDLILIFSVVYCAFIYWEYIKFREKAQFEFSKASAVILVISLVIVITSLLLSLKL